MDYAKKIKVYEFFGVQFNETKGQELIATCPFCGKDNHFFVNNQTSLFNCKRCGLQGTYKDFLTQIYNDLLPSNELNKFHKLAEYRRLPVEAFDGYGILALNDQYWIPIYDQVGKIQDLRHFYIGKQINSVTGAELGIFNLKDLLNSDRHTETVYICEGEPDAIAMNFLLKKNSKKGVVIGIPGANVLKKEWHDWFNNRDIINCFDNDGAGEKGFDKSKAQLNGYKSIKRVFWPNNLPKGYDINEFVSVYGVKDKKYDLCLNILNTWIKDTSSEVSISEIQAKYQHIPEDPNLADLIVEYKKSLKVNKEYENAIRVMLSTIMSVNIPGPDPLWIFFVGPPSSGKTALLNTARNSNLCFYQSTLGRHSLISGFRTPTGSDPSILGQLRNKCFILKDFTEVLFKSSSDRDEIFSILRGAFDGYVERHFGNNVSRVYKSLKFSMIAGVTQEINSYPQASAGERFLRYNFNYDIEGIEIQQEMALNQAVSGDEVKEDLQVWVNNFLTRPFDFSNERIQLYRTRDFTNRLIPLARLIAYLRTPVIRFEKGRKSELPVYEPIAESGNRISVQLQRLAISLAILEEKDAIDDSIYGILKKVAFDTVEGYATRIIKILFNAQKELTKHEIADQLDRKINLAPFLEDLELLRMINSKTTLVQNKSILGYYLSPTIFELFSRVELG